MADYARGTVLSCSHEAGPCRVRIEVECHRETAGEAYRCTCGALMIEVVADDG